MITTFSRGAGALLHGLNLLRQPGVRGWAVLPILINLVVFFTLFWLLGGWFSTQISDWIAQLPGWLAWLEWLLWLLFIAMALIIFYTTFTVVSNLIAAPFNALLAEAVARYLGETVPESSWRSVLRLLPRTLWDEVAKLWYMLKWLIVVVIITFIPLTTPIAPILWLLYAAWMSGFEYYGYPGGIIGLTHKDILARMRRQRPMLYGFGAATTLAGMVPLLNILVMPSAVAAATWLWYRHPAAEGGHPR
jgi:CysZ protein